MTSGNRPDIPRKHDTSRAAAVEVHYGTDENLSPGSVTDIGMGRLQLVGQTHFPVGTELELQFGHRAGRSSGVIRMKASVQQSQPGKMAIAFVSVKRSDQTKTFSTIRQLAASRRK